MEYLKKMHTRLAAITRDCRPDMHEPSEQDLKARLVGDHLDNACGESIQEEAISRGFQEYVVILERYDNGKILVEKFNLATLIALARYAKFDSKDEVAGLYSSTVEVLPEKQKAALT